MTLWSAYSVLYAVPMSDRVPAAAEPRRLLLQRLADLAAADLAIAPVEIEIVPADYVRAAIDSVSDAVAYYSPRLRRIVISYNEVRRANSAVAYADAVSVLAHELAHAVDFDRRADAADRHDHVFVEVLNREVHNVVHAYRDPADNFNRQLAAV